MMLKNKVAVVTGSSKRTGKAIALALAENGADVVIHYNKSKNEAEKVVKKIRSFGRKSTSVSANLTKPKEIKSMFNQIYN